MLSLDVAHGFKSLFLGLWQHKGWFLSNGVEKSLSGDNFSNIQNLQAARWDVEGTCCGKIVLRKRDYS